MTENQESLPNPFKFNQTSIKKKSLTLQTPSTQIDRPLKFFLTISGLEHNVPSTTVLLNVAKNFEPIGLQLSSHSASSVINT